MRSYFRSLFLLVMLFITSSLATNANAIDPIIIPCQGISVPLANINCYLPIPYLADDVFEFCWFGSPVSNLYIAFGPPTLININGKRPVMCPGDIACTFHGGTTMMTPILTDPFYYPLPTPNRPMPTAPAAFPIDLTPTWCPCFDPVALSLWMATCMNRTEGYTP
jgi:hypothetical protein